DGCIIGADRFEHAQAVLVDVDAGAGGTQLLGALMHAHTPAPLRERAGGGEPGKPGAGDFGVALRHMYGMLWQRGRRPLRRRHEEDTMARLRHFAVCVTDLEKAANFYETVFELKRAGREDLDIGSAIYLTDGVINLALLNFSAGAGAKASDMA